MGWFAHFHVDVAESISMEPLHMTYSLVGTMEGLLAGCILGTWDKFAKGGPLNTQAVTHTHVGAAFGNVPCFQDHTPLVPSQIAKCEQNDKDIGHSQLKKKVHVNI